jgi:hypothetical protein
MKLQVALPLHPTAAPPDAGLRVSPNAASSGCRRRIIELPRISHPLALPPVTLQVALPPHCSSFASRSRFRVAPSPASSGCADG